MGKNEINHNDIMKSGDADEVSPLLLYFIIETTHMKTKNAVFFEGYV